jgi:hypothetical protein
MDAKLQLTFWLSGGVGSKVTVLRTITRLSDKFCSVYEGRIIAFLSICQKACLTYYNTYLTHTAISNDNKITLKKL